MPGLSVLRTGTLQVQGALSDSATRYLALHVIRKTQRGEMQKSPPHTSTLPRAAASRDCYPPRVQAHSLPQEAGLSQATRRLRNKQTAIRTAADQLCGAYNSTQTVITCAHSSSSPLAPEPARCTVPAPRWIRFQVHCISNVSP